MENKAHAMAAGIFVLAIAALLAALAVWLTRDKGTTHVYEISTRETVTGLQEQAPVRYRGVDVGKVESIGFDPKAQGNVLIRLDVDEKAPVSVDTFATLGFQGVTGLSFVQLEDSGKPAAKLAPNDAQPPRIPLRQGLIAKLTEKGEQILDKVDVATTRFNEMLAPEKQQKLFGALDNLGEAAASVGRMSTSLNYVINAQLGPQKTDIPQLVKSTTLTMQSLQKTSAALERTAQDFGDTARRLNEKDGPIDRLAEGTDSLSHAADSFNAATLPRINRVSEETQRAMRQLRRTVNNINDNPQSLIFGTGDINPGPGEPGFSAGRAGK